LQAHSLKGIELPTRRAVVITDRNWRIEFATRSARGWFDKYFLPRRDSQRLPSVLRSWLEHPKRRKNVVVIQKAHGKLWVSSLESEQVDRCCLFLEEAESSVAEQTSARRLSAREMEVLNWVARGKSNSEIAALLNLKTATVKKHLERIFPKLGVENRTAAAHFALLPSE
jgi:DNA-binding NarL/FixJ family response regulator